MLSFSPHYVNTVIFYHVVPVQQTLHVHPMLVKCWADVVDGGPTLGQFLVFAVYGLGCQELYNVDSRLARCRIFREISCFSPLNTRTLWYQFYVLRQGFLPSCASPYSGVNKYLIRQRCQFLYNKLLAPHHVTWLQCCMLPGELKWYMNEQGIIM